MLPPRLVHRRLAIQIQEFLDWLDSYYCDRDWLFGPRTVEPEGATGADIEAWVSRDVRIAVAERDDDGRVVCFRVELRNIPSVVDRVLPATGKRPAMTSSEGEPVIGFEHSFDLYVPPNYPSDLRSRFLNRTDTMHPRMLPPEREAPACIFPQADIDATLRELIGNLLFRPDMVRAPEQFEGADPGFRPYLMVWYSEYGPQRMHELLRDAWHDRQIEIRDAAAADAPPALPDPPPADPDPPAAGFRILPDAAEDAGDTLPSAPEPDRREPPDRPKPPRSLFQILDEE